MMDSTFQSENAPRREAAEIERRTIGVLGAHRAGLLPIVTLAWAQSSLGAIAGRGGARTTLSSPESMALTHRLRAMHDAILVGIRTVLSDDPLLSVRLAVGAQPQPVVLDSRLRFPPSARLLSREDRKPWIFHAAGRGSAACESAARELERRGARLFGAAAADEGLDLREVLSTLRSEGIRSLMVEGGAIVLRAFLGAGLASHAVVTVSPSTVEGTPGPGMPQFTECVRAQVGPDTVIWGRLAHPTS